jgi:hypothetical protein
MRVAKRWEELEAKAQTTADLTIEDGLKLLAAPKKDVDIDANLEFAARQLREAADLFNTIPKEEWTPDSLYAVMNLADECIRHAHATKIDNMTLLGEILSLLPAGRAQERTDGTLPGNPSEET